MFPNSILKALPLWRILKWVSHVCHILPLKSLGFVKEVNTKVTDVYSVTNDFWIKESSFLLITVSTKVWRKKTTNKKSPITTVNKLHFKVY